MNISKTVTKPLRKLFSPSALAATVATGMLVQVAVASGGGGQNCLSQCATLTDPSQCDPNVHCQNVYTRMYWCCPLGDTCGASEYFNCGANGGGWCVCPN